MRNLTVEKIKLLDIKDYSMTDFALKMKVTILESHSLVHPYVDE